MNLKLSRKQRILAADDSKEFLFGDRVVPGFVALLSDAGFEVESERFANSVVEHALKFRPDLITLDLFFEETFPNGWGETIYKELREAGWDLPVVMLMAEERMSKPGWDDAKKDESNKKHYVAKGDFEAILLRINQILKPESSA